jgi:hypothetical protein
MNILNTNTEYVSKDVIKEYQDRYESEPCRKQSVCDFLGIQDEYFDNTPVVQYKRNTPDFMSEVLKTRQELIKLGFIKG